ncbi:hypothetical protein [Pseudoalteromonas sp. P1-25]|uniref:hypothetical protein n=1 Tax=Pseudoalteromonas sp. P1-25 TaxID=1723758 RepID=UPI0006D65418|nr:hypothetical protein [Pseudoalteromonas sp. P1-25]KPZ53194.1 hypothetical protein AN393_02919 [Pseudoalteromonas sp. P1-25]
MDSSYFRDKMLSQIIIGYDWDTSNNFAEITLVSNDGIISSFKICQLAEYSLYEDFSASYISQCKLIVNNSMVYLSLDPYDELSNEIDLDNDCLWFKGSNITTV